MDRQLPLWFNRYAMKLSDLIADQPPVRRVEGARAWIRQNLNASGKKLVIIDDDPTGAQAIQDVRVLMDWSVNTLRRNLTSPGPVFFISTNSRSLDPEEAERISLEVGENLREAATHENADIILASRSDSTLRGHFPTEVKTLASGLGISPDGIIIVPAFFEGGRYTVNDIHLAEQEGELVPVHETEFARDPAFGFKNSDLKKWVEEKTGGQVKAGDVISISLKTIREGGPEAVAESLSYATGMNPVIANAACYEDLEILSLGIISAEEKGRVFIYRCAASFIKARGGFEDRELLTRRELAPGSGPGLIIAGSYAEKTTRQLKYLLDSGYAEGIELNVSGLGTESGREKEIRSVSDRLNRILGAGKNAVVRTSREFQFIPELGVHQTGIIIIQTLCAIVRNLTHKPAFIITKGGVTSIGIARTALCAGEAFAIGQILPGVPVWRLAEGARWTDIPFVVFPGNVGNDDAVLKAVQVLEGV